ncbi:MAG: DUF2442 domain-containing protein [Gemmataceae bacterium]
MILRITKAEVLGPHLLRLTFNTGVTKVVSVNSLLVGPIFEPLRDASYFTRMLLDPVCGTVTWPNGADFAPEALMELPAIEDVTNATRSGAA